MESIDPVIVVRRLHDFEEVIEMVRMADSESAIALIPKVRTASFALVECVGDGPTSLAITQVRDAAMQVLEGMATLERWRHMLAMDCRIMRDAVHLKLKNVGDS